MANQLKNIRLMANKKILLQLAKKAKDYLSIYKKLRNKHSFSEYEGNAEIYMAIDRVLQLTIECSIDIGKEIITGLELEKPLNYKHVFVILSRKKIINHNLSEEMQEMAGFRNELVHDYLYLDPKKVFNIFQDKFKIFENYLKAIETFLKKELNS